MGPEAAELADPCVHLLQWRRIHLVHAPGAFSANAGIEFRPTSNVTLSLGASFTQHSSGAVDSDINSPLLPGQSPLAIGGRTMR